MSNYGFEGNTYSRYPDGSGYYENFDASLENERYAGSNEEGQGAETQQYTNEHRLPGSSAPLGRRRPDREQAQVYAHENRAIRQSYVQGYRENQGPDGFGQRPIDRYDQTRGSSYGYPSVRDYGLDVISYPPPSSQNLDATDHDGRDYQHRIEPSQNHGSSVSTGSRPIQQPTGRPNSSWPQHALPTVLRTTPASSDHDEQCATSRNSREIIDLGDSEAEEDDIATPHETPEPVASNDDNTESATPKIDWKLPEYEATYFIDPNGWPIAKISIPGMVRNEVQLNVDSPDLEFNMFQSVFFPMHKRTYPSPMKDPEPKHSALNFHIIANIFISVFRTLEEESQTAAKDADTDEVFFSAIDNWRVGRELGRKEYSMIRGIQEFCDIGLDILFWLKAHGLGLGTEKKRRERSDKGMKRGPRASKRDAGTGPSGAKAKKGAAGAKKTNKLVAKRQTKKAATNNVKDGRVKKKK